MPQNPTKSSLFVTRLIAGLGITLSPTKGTGIVTITADQPTSSFASPPPIGDTTPNTGAFTTLTADTVAGAVNATTLSTTTTGTFTANGATAVVVADTNVTANSVVMFTMKTVGGTPAGAPFLSAVTAGTGFSVKAAAGDTSVYNYAIIN